MIEEARISDTGEYICIVENDAGMDRKRFFVNVLGNFLKNINKFF